MRRGRILILVGLLLIVLIAAAAILLPRFLSPATTEQGSTDVVAPTPAVDTVDVVVLTQPVKRGTVLDESVLGIIRYQKDLYLDVMFQSLDAVAGRKARVDLENGAILTSAMLVDVGDVLKPEGSDWALVMEPGSVAVSIPISRLSSVSYGPQAGDHVDVIATLLLVDLDTEFQTLKPNRVGGVVSPGQGVIIGQGTGDETTASLSTSELVNRVTAQIAPGGGAGVQGRTELDPTLSAPFYVVPSEQFQRPRMVSQSVLQNVIVLRVGNFTMPDDEGNMQPVPQAAPTPEAGQETVQGTQTGQVEAQNVERPPDVITLIVSPQDAITLNFLVYSGAELTLALRAASDEEVRPLEAVTTQYLLEQYNIPVPVKLPYGFQPRVDELIAPVLPNDQPVQTTNQ